MRVTAPAQDLAAGEVSASAGVTPDMGTSVLPDIASPTQSEMSFMRRPQDMTGSGGEYVPAADLSGSSADSPMTGMFSSASPIQLLSDERPGTSHVYDRFMRVPCRHSTAGCSRAAVRAPNNEQFTTCAPCGAEEARARAVLRGCIACTSSRTGPTPSVVNAVMMGSSEGASSSATVATTCTSTRSQATTVPVASPMDAVMEYEHHVATATASMERMLLIDPGYMDTQGQDQLRAVIRRLSYSPQTVHAEVHAETPVRDAVPMVVVCSRCEQDGHKKAACKAEVEACSL